MNVVVTTGPAIARIDEVRHLTNVSSGELGVLVANAFASAGDEVTCFYGAASRCVARLDARVSARVFSGNEDLAEALRQRGSEGKVDAIFHVAALGDFEVSEVRGADGRRLADAKIESRSGEVTLVLKPARKVIVELRDWFPGSCIVGWKYELNGGREEALAAGRRQMTEARSDACVVNGRAYGAGFGLLTPDGALAEFADKPALAEGLKKWLRGEGS